MRLRSQSLSGLWMPVQYFLAILMIIFLAEAGVMYLLPLILPVGVDHSVEAILDATILTIVSAPILWQLLIHPLRTAASDEAQKYTAMMAGARDGILTLDQHGTIESANTALIAMTGMTLQQLQHSPITKLFPK